MAVVLAGLIATPVSNVEKLAISGEFVLPGRNLWAELLRPHLLNVLGAHQLGFLSYGSVVIGLLASTKHWFHVQDHHPLLSLSLRSLWHLPLRGSAWCVPLAKLTWIFLWSPRQLSRGRPFLMGPGSMSLKENFVQLMVWL